MQTTKEFKSISRRKFFGSVGVAFATVAGSAAIAEAESTSNHPASLPSSDNPINDTLHMHDDLQRALKKPIGERHWTMVIDNRKCIGCNACSVACMAENNLPPGVTYRKVLEVEDGEYPDLKRYFMPTNCMQCAKAPCIEASNKVIPGSMSRRLDGIVTIDYKKMKGRKVFDAASTACPYPYSLYYDEGKNYTDGTPQVQPYEKRTFIEYGKMLTRKDTKDTTRKCHFCIQRIESGMLPACVSTCTGQAMYFGNANDPASLVSTLVKNEKSIVLEGAQGTVPGLRFVDDDPETTCFKCHS